MKKILLLLMSLSLLIGCNNNTVRLGEVDELGNVEAVTLVNDLEIHFIDVGQADSILIQSNGEVMLIDAGNNGDGELIKSYLTNYNVGKLKYVIGTHPHEDHIGALDTIINNFDIETVIMPQKVTTTKTFEDVVTAIENKNLSITAPKVGDKYQIGEAEFTIISPVKEDYGDNLNNYSVGLLLSHGENKFLFTGDAEKEVEEDILNTGINIDADLMKMGHHGSTTSNSNVFLDKITPEIAIITCGVDNSYGHPHQEILEELNRRNVEIYRTDLQGNIIVTSNGKSIDIKTAKNTIVKMEDKIEDKVEVKVENEAEIKTEYVLNTNSKVVHYSSCSSVKKMSEKNKEMYTGVIEEIIKNGYKSCGICKPE